MDSSQVVPEAVLTPSTRVFQGPMITCSSEVQRTSPRRRTPFSIEDIIKSDDVKTSEINLTDRTPLTRSEVACEDVITTINPEGFGGLRHEQLFHSQSPASPQTSTSDGKLDHPRVDILYLQNKFKRCEIPAFPVSLHQPKSNPEPRLSPPNCTDSPQTTCHSYIPSPSHAAQQDILRWKTCMLRTSSEAYADELTDVESASPNESTASSGFYSNSSPSHSSDSSSISGRTSPGAQDDRSSPQSQEDDNVSVETAPITKEEAISEKSSIDTQKEGCVLANTRKNYSGKQVRRLKQVFLENKYPDVELYEDLSQELKIPVKRLKVWFQNRRARNKTDSDTKMINYPIQHQSMAAMLSSAPGHPYMPPMMHQPMYQYPTPHVPSQSVPRYPPSVYSGYPYPLYYQH